MITLPNFLSFLRFPLALVFLQSNEALRLFGIGGAVLTDFFDGYLARRYKITSKEGTLLDPLSDKFFVLVALVVLMQEGLLNAWEALSLLSRDGALLLYGVYLVSSKQWSSYEFRAIWSGKVATTLQLLLLVALTLHYPVPETIYYLFVLLGFSALCELYLSPKKMTVFPPN